MIPAGTDEAGGQRAARQEDAATGWTGGHNPWAVALVVTLATFMEVLDTSIANVSLPHIAGNLSVTQNESTWVLTSYLVSNAVVLPVSGWFASRFGRKRFYMTCVALFATSSLLCGLAPSLGALVAFRVLQGIGGGGLAPSEQAILADTFPANKRGMAFAVYGMAVVLAPAVGPTLGGYITDHASWRWIFFINVPVGAASLALSSRFVSDPPHVRAAQERSGPIDFVGLGLIALGLGSLEVVLDKGQEDNWFESSFILGFSITAAVALISFVLWERKQKAPVVDVHMFRDRNFASSNFMMLILGLTLYGSTVLLPQFLQVLMGYTAERAGMALSPGGFVVMMFLPLVGLLVSRVDTRLLIGFGFAVLSLSLFHMTRNINLAMDFGTAVRLRAYQSAGLAFLFVPINNLVFVGVPPEKNNAVSGVVNLARNLGGDIGIAFVTTFVARRAQFHQERLAAHAVASDPTVTATLGQIARALAHAGGASADATRGALALFYRQLQAQATTLAYLDVLRVMGFATAAMVPLLLLTRRPPKGAPQGAH
ncbi:MAG TPA: DHA2 family efflux MFS transporter permease subunit [Polyangia bacterium]|nr:DHA2 family efflux MFS transporter permease subunit [Polyangia bacterium]